MSIALSEKETAPLNYFLHSYGPASTPTLHLGWVFASIAVMVFLIVAGLLAGALVHKRPQNSGNIDDADKGLQWIYIGTGISTCLLLGMAVYALITLNAIARPPQATALTLTVTGYDWWWKVEYEHADPSLNFVTANEIHIPVGVPVLVKLKSADVIHAFWVPVLAGKTQMIPGLINRQWLQADVPGIYRGECTQYCGLQHAHMALEVIAQNAAEFRQWQAAQRKRLVLPPASDADAGRKVFMEHCSGCHSIRGTEAIGAHAPDLTHLKSRRLIAAGTLTNTPEHRQQWITHAQEIKPGARMPSMVLSPVELTALSAFLSTLD
ncbi:cytochrome c oxidase subunit II [Methylobacter sp. YRD-M1]|uniref:cytochrome c oxidase subunit II n=1 Tax=Methylobacter sp. YRD-M1 TaxID=2911520 RepID=UPI00227A13F4|nr:c-type cytochrome [Methylobacter sp. YRD-M1]WAK02636.1 c-type cytochrome [Methylobacter sp. YRD-M1]